jgi:hypothetical protein
MDRDLKLKLLARINNKECIICAEPLSKERTVILIHNEFDLVEVHASHDKTLLQ